MQHRRLFGIPARAWCIFLAWGCCSFAMGMVARRIDGITGQIVWFFITVAIGALLGWTLGSRGF